MVRHRMPAVLRRGAAAMTVVALAALMACGTGTPGSSTPGSTKTDNTIKVTVNLPATRPGWTVDPLSCSASAA